MDRFLALLERSFPFALPRADLVREVGDDFADVLVAAGLLEEVPVRLDDPWPCPGPVGDGCPRRVVGSRGSGLVVVCGQEPAECADLALGPEEARVVRVGPRRFLVTLARALGALPVLPDQIDTLRPIRLGERDLGARRVGFTFVPRPGSRLLPTLLGASAASGSDDLCSCSSSPAGPGSRGARDGPFPRPRLALPRPLPAPRRPQGCGRPGRPGPPA